MSGTVRPAGIVGVGVAVAAAGAVSVVGTSFVRYLTIKENIGVRWSAGLVPTLAAWPFPRSFGGARVGDFVIVFLAALVVAAAAAGLLAALGAFGAAPGRGAVSVAMSSWFATVLAGAVAGFVATKLQQELLYASRPLGFPWWYGFSTGAYWGLVTGWFSAVLGAAAFLALGRPRATAAPSHVTSPDQ